MCAGKLRTIYKDEVGTIWAGVGLHKFNNLKADEVFSRTVGDQWPCCRKPESGSSEAARYGYAQLSGCSSAWKSQRTEHGVRPLAFIFCASLASTRGAALDPALHSQSLVAGHGPDPTRILARSPGGRATSLLLSALLTFIRSLASSNLRSQSRKPSASKWVYLARKR